MSTIEHDNSYTSKPRHTVPLAVSGRNDDSHMEVEMMDKSLSNQPADMNVESLDSNSHMYKKNIGVRNL